MLNSSPDCIMVHNVECYSPASFVEIKDVSGTVRVQKLYIFCIITGIMPYCNGRINGYYLLMCLICRCLLMNTNIWRKRFMTRWTLILYIPFMLVVFIAYPWTIFAI